MNIKEYISSGVIEAYVLGIATDEELREIEKLRSQHPELELAIQEQEALLGQYAQAHSISPAPQLKQHIWERIQAETEIKSEEDKVVKTPKISLDSASVPKQSVWKQFLMAASVALLIASGLGNFWMMGQNKKMAQDLAVLSTQQKLLLEEKNTAIISAQKANQAMAILSLPSLKKINLAGVGTHSQHSGMLYWDVASGDVFLDLNCMPAAPEGMQYQLWAIVDGKPVDAGMYDASNGQMEKMKRIPKAEMFAITIEKQGGSPTPSLDKMVVAGKTS